MCGRLEMTLCIEMSYIIFNRQIGNDILTTFSWAISFFCNHLNAFDK